MHFKFGHCLLIYTGSIEKKITDITQGEFTENLSTWSHTLWSPEGTNDKKETQMVSFPFKKGI